MKNRPAQIRNSPVVIMDNVLNIFGGRRLRIIRRFFMPRCRNTGNRIIKVIVGHLCHILYRANVTGRIQVPNQYLLVAGACYEGLMRYMWVLSKLH